MTRKRTSRRPARRRAPYLMPLLIALAILAAGCIWATHTWHKNQGTPNTPAISTKSEELQKVAIPANLPSQTKRYEGFTVDFNASNRTANYVSWELLGTETDGASSRSGEKFWQDPDIKNCPRTSDYTRSGYDRGHLYPAADAKWSPQSMTQCFTMANITPQVHALNGGAWKTLEDKERQWAQRDSALIIIAGPIYTPDDKLRIGQADVRVPSAYFKVLLAPYLDNPRAIAFIYPNTHCPGNMENYACTVDYVETLTGFDFFSSLPDDTENAIESAYSFKDWNKR